jgi:hypothetical protein
MHRNGRRHGGIVWRIAAVVAGIVVIAIVVLYCLAGLSERQRARQSRTIYALSNLEWDLASYLGAHGSLPGPTLRDAMDALEEENGRKYYQDILGVNITAPGVDGWGRPLIYELRDPTHAVIRSVGPNGVDENGKGDDIERKVLLD